MIDLGDRRVNSTIRFKWSTNASTGGSITRATDGAIRIYKDDSTTERSSSAGITDSEDFDSVTGVHHLSIDLSNNTDSGFYAAGHDYFVVLVGAVVDGQTVNYPIAMFSIENRNTPVDATKINGVATTSVTAVNANVGTTQPINFTSTGASAAVRSDLRSANGVTGVAANLATVFNTDFGTNYDVTNQGWIVNTAYFNGVPQTPRDIGAGVNVQELDGDSIQQLDGYQKSVGPFTSGVVPHDGDDTTSGTTLKNAYNAASFGDVIFSQGNFITGSTLFDANPRVRLVGVGPWSSRITSNKSLETIVANDYGAIVGCWINATGSNGDALSQPDNSDDIHFGIYDSAVSSASGQGFYPKQTSGPLTLGVERTSFVGPGASLGVGDTDHLAYVCDSRFLGAVEPALYASNGGQMFCSRVVSVTEETEPASSAGSGSVLTFADSFLLGKDGSVPTLSGGGKIYKVGGDRNRSTPDVNQTDFVEHFGAVRPLTPGRRAKISSANVVDSQTVLVGPSGSGETQTAADLGAMPATLTTINTNVLSRLAAADAPANFGAQSITADGKVFPADGSIDNDVVANSAVTKMATGVRTELTTELARIDIPVSEAGGDVTLDAEDIEAIAAGVAAELGDIERADFATEAVHPSKVFKLIDAANGFVSEDVKRITRSDTPITFAVDWVEHLAGNQKVLRIDSVTFLEGESGEDGVTVPAAADWTRNGGSRTLFTMTPATVGDYRVRLGATYSNPTTTDSGEILFRVVD